MELHNGESQIAGNNDLSEAKDTSRNHLVHDALSSHDKRAYATEKAKEIVDIVNKDGNFGKSGEYGPPEDKDIVKQILKEARQEDCLDELTRDLNMQMIQQKSDLRFDLDKHTYFLTEPTNNLYTINWDKLTLTHNGSRAIDTVAARTEQLEKLP